MRIVQVLHGWPPEAMGGTGLYVEALAEALRSGGDEVAILAPRVGPGPQMLRVQGGWLLQAPAPKRWEQTFHRPELDAVLRRWLREWRPDVLHVHHLSGHPWGMLGEAHESDARVVLTLHDYAIPCGRGQLVNREGLLCPGPDPERCAACLSEQLRLNPISQVLGRLLQALPGLRTRARAALGRPRSRDLARAEGRIAAARAALEEADVLLSPSEDLARRIAGFGMRAPALCALPLVRPVAPAPPPGEGPMRFLFASALLPTKGPLDLLTAFARLPQGLATLSLAGPAPAVDGQPDFARQLRARVEATPGARWLGAVPPEQMSALFAQHDVLVLPSRWPENSPLVVREAAAAGLRLIVGALGGAPALVPAARAVPPRDGDALLLALQAEIARGRGRNPPMDWPTAAEHAAWLRQAIYLRGGAGDASSCPGSAGPVGSQAPR